MSYYANELRRHGQNAFDDEAADELDRLEDENAKLLEFTDALNNWLPTTGNINALPKPLREYIHNLETIADPAGTVRENAIAVDTIAGLEVLLVDEKSKNAALQAKIDALMLEHCPDEMTPEQRAEWVKHQRAVTGEEAKRIDTQIEEALFSTGNALQDAYRVVAAKKEQAQPAAQPAVPEGWLRVVDEEMVCCHLGVANPTDTYEEAKKKLSELIQWHIAVATDPAVNGGWALVPVEPTKDMRASGRVNMGYVSCTAEQVWAAMLSAAPTPKGNQHE